MSDESGRVAEEVRRFLVKWVAAQAQSNAVMGLQIEMSGKCFSSGKSLLVPAPECVRIGLEVEKREPVCSMSQKGSQKSLSLRNSTHEYPRTPIDIDAVISRRRECETVSH